MNEVKVFSIGKIVNEEENVKVVVEQKYAEGLKGLEGDSHVQILWWMDGCDNGYYDASEPPVRLSGSQCSGGIEPL